MQMHKKQTVQSIVMGKDNFSVTIYPNIDYAFIVALIVILDEINQESKEEWDDEIPVICLYKEFKLFKLAVRYRVGENSNVQEKHNYWIFF